ncbi:MAG: PEP-CTERM sorting domain-containing protein [Myxococcota bacterium]
MTRIGFSSLLRLSAFGILLTISPAAFGQSVAMSGEYGSSAGGLLNIPVNPPKTACVQAGNARCHFAQTVFGGTPNNIPLAEPSSGVGVGGAGAIIMEGGLSVGDPFTVPPGAFQQNAGPQYTPIVNNPSLIQLDTTFVFSMPAAARAVNPPTATRVFQANGWSASGNGQTGRVAANTTPVDAATQPESGTTVRYSAGLNAFGGTMAALRDGEGRFYAVNRFVGTLTPPDPATLPQVGTIRLGDGIAGNPNTRFGAGWGYTRMEVRAPGVLINQAGIGAPCTVATPPGPAGCGLVTDFTGDVIGTVQGATSTRHLYAWTTGTVEVTRDGTIAGFPSVGILTAMGYDTTSMTLSGGTVRNLGLVAGAYTRRTPAVFGDPTYGREVVGVNMQFTPEPGSTAGLLIGLGVLGLLSARRREGPGPG